MKKVTIVNKFGPASNAITGQNARELADYLFQNNVEVRFVCLRAEYQSAQQSTQTNTPYAVSELKSVYTGRSPGLRFIAGLVDGFRLWLSSLNKRSDAVIVMTDPPLLFMWFQLFRAFSKRKLIYWTMDLYPEAFVAGNYIKPSNIVYKLFHSIVYRRKPDLAIVLGQQQYAYLKTKFRTAFAHVIVPCGVIERNGAAATSQLSDHKITFGYGGNMGEAHDANFLLALARQLDPEKHQMIVSLYGSKAAQVKHVIVNNKNVHFRDFLNLNDIASMDVNVASLLPEWNHICVPSKAVTAICCGSSLLLNATKEADNWQMFSDAAWLVESGKDYDTELRRSLEKITMEGIREKRQKARELAASIVREKNQAYRQVAEFISTL